MSARDRSSSVPESTTQAPKLVVLLGRGRVGKSTLGMWMAERARLEGRSLIIADIDRTVATLPAFFGDVSQPDSGEDDDVSGWLNALFETQIEKRSTILLDTGGGDTLFGRYAKAFGLSQLLESAGVEAVAVHVMGPSRDDLTVLRDCEESGDFAPERVILVRNAAQVQGSRSADAAFKEVVSHKVYRQAVERGAREVLMPRLDNMNRLVAANALFNQAATDNALKVVATNGARDPFGLFNRRLVWLWLKAMTENFEPVAGWLP